MSNTRLGQRELHLSFVSALDGAVIRHSDLNTKPLEVDLKPPLPHRVRLYMFNATYPPGGRTLGEHKIQLIVPGQQSGQRGSFDHSDSRIVLLVGYRADLRVFILWDAGLYPDFAYSRNVQVNAETVYAALAGKIGRQERLIRGQGKEMVLTARANLLRDALLERMQLTLKRVLGG